MISMFPSLYISLFIRRQLRSAFRRRIRKFSLDETLLYAISALVEFLVHNVDLGKIKAVTQHDTRIELALLKKFEQVLPVEVYRCLAVANKAHATFHQGTDIEMIRLMVEVSNTQMKARSCILQSQRKPQ